MTHGGEEESTGNRHGEFHEKAKRVVLLKVPVKVRLLDMSAKKKEMHLHRKPFHQLSQNH